MNKKLWVLSILAIAGVVSFVWGGSAEASCVWTGTSCFENVTVNVQILPGDVCIGTTGAFNFGSYTVSSSSQVRTGAFTSELWVEDLKWSNTGYYTTVQMSGNMTGPGSATIGSGNVSFRVPSTGVTLMAWSTNTGVVLSGSTLTTFTALNSPITFLQRKNGANFGLIGKYGKIPELQILIPAYQSVGTYTGTLVYTLYENNP